MGSALQTNDGHVANIRVAMLGELFEGPPSQVRVMSNLRHGPRTSRARHLQEQRPRFLRMHDYRFRCDSDERAILIVHQRQENGQESRITRIKQRDKRGASTFARGPLRLLNDNCLSPGAAEKEVCKLQPERRVHKVSVLDRIMLPINRVALRVCGRHGNRSKQKPRGETFQCPRRSAGCKWPIVNRGEPDGHFGVIMTRVRVRVRLTLG